MWRSILLLLVFLPGSCAPSPQGSGGKRGDSDLLAVLPDSTKIPEAAGADEQIPDDFGTPGPGAETNPQEVAESDLSPAVDVEKETGDSKITPPQKVVKAHFQISSGGGSLDSSGYTLQLFVAPTSFVGRTQSAGYRLVLGPASAFIGQKEKP
jgi:hypothetical protein